MGKLITSQVNHKGVIEIFCHGDQPKAGAFTNFCWEVMDSLICGKTVLTPFAPRLTELNSAARILRLTCKDAERSRRT